MNDSGFPVWFYIAPMLFFGPVVVWVLYNFAYKNLGGLGGEIKEARKAKKDEYLEARRRRGFV